MRTQIPEKLLKIVDEIDLSGSASITKLTVIKKWFSDSSRIKSFSIYLAKKACSRSGKAKSDEKELFIECRELLNLTETISPKLPKLKVNKIIDKLFAYQNGYRKGCFTVIREIKNWNLFIIELALKSFIGPSDPVIGYELFSKYCQHYDSKYGNSLNGPSKQKILETVRFMYVVEAKEE